MSKKILPNKDAIKTHLEFLFSGQNDGLIEISSTPANSKSVSISQFFSVNNISDAVEYAYNTNSKDGCNVYVGAALRHPDTAPFGRSSIKDYHAATSIWCDLDDAQAAQSAKDKYNGLAPSLVVVTGRHPNLRAQMWWKLETPANDPSQVKESLAHLREHFDGDKSVVDPIRVMRLGGTVAWPKKDGRVPELTTVIIPPNATKQTNIENIKSYFPAPNLLTHNGAGDVGHKEPLFKEPKTTKEQADWSITDVCNMLNHIHPDGDYLDWVAVGMALKDYGVDFGVWDAWSSKGSKYPNSNELFAKWNSFKSSGVSIGTIYYHAHNGGYRPADYNEKPLTLRETVDFDHETGEIIDVKEMTENGKKQTKRLPLLYASDVSPVLETSDFVEGLLRDNEFSVIYGQSNCGKTFFMLDLAMHVALGKKWRDKDVEQGGVIYAALEGGHGTRNRIFAFREHYGVKGEIPLAIIPSTINFLDEKDDMPAFINAVKEAKERLGDVRLIVIDTLARAISGGDENSSMDMGRLIINADVIRQITGAHIAFVHHSGKDDLKGARGHSSLRAAVDTEIEISRPDTESPSTIKIVKQREMDMGEDMHFSLSSIVLGENRRGQNVTSCVVVPSESVEKKSPSKTLNPVQQFIYDCLIEAMHTMKIERHVLPNMPPVECVSYDDLRVVMESNGFKEMMETDNKSTAQQIKSATQTARLALKKYGKVNFNGKYIWPVLGDNHD